jgi:hypothetical protein
MNSTNNIIEFQSLSGRDIFIGLGNVWLYSDTCMPAPLTDVPQWLVGLAS